MNLQVGNFFSAAFICFLATTNVLAATYSVPPANEALIGNLKTTTAEPGDTVVTVAKRYDIGFNAIENSNPTLDMARGFQTGTILKIPTQHLLPNQAREGIVINLPEMRMYYYVGNGEVRTYPIGIGKIGKTIPIKKTSITYKKKNPSWIPPQDIREFNLQQGIVLPKIMPPGPDNPLGPYAVYMSIPTYLIHSTIFPESVGKRASFGCIRMYESDIQSFFPSIKSGIPVVIVNAPAKVGWQNNVLYFEAHEPLEEHETDISSKLAGMVHLISANTKDQPTLVDWQSVSYIAKEKDGIPHDIGIRIQ